MALDSTTWRPAASVDPDVAFLNVNGGLTLYVWVEHRLRVRAQILITHEQGQQTLLWEGTIATAATDHLLTCTRCVTVADQYFVVYWMDYDSNAGTYVLESRYSDMDALNSAISWTAMSDITPDDAGLYDVKNIEGASPTEYMLVWASSTSQCIVRRVISNDHTNVPTGALWSTTITTNHADRVLAVHADADAGSDNGGVLVVVQDGDNDLVGHILDWSDGTSVRTDNIVAGATREFAAVGIARSTLSAPTVRAAVIAEFQDTAITPTATEEDYAHFIVMQEMRIDATGGTVGNSHVTPNLNMMSKPYSYADAEGDMHVYCGLGYKTVNYPAQWTQSVGFVCDMGLQHWGETANTIRPRPCLTLNLANVDADIHGANTESSAQVSNGQGKRVNHLSNWITGPSWLCDTRKSRTVAWGMWSRMTQREDGTGGGGMAPGSSTAIPSPAGPSVRGIVHVLEDAWTVNRDDLDYSQPSSNFHACNALTLYNTTTTAESLLVAGGTPQLYDGEAIVEIGFPWDPEIVAIEDNPTGSATMEAGDYRYLAVYEWTDARGQLHRSGHGRPVTFENDGNDNPLITVRTLTISNRDAGWLYPEAQKIVIALYRNTQSTPNRFYRLHATELPGWTPADMPINDPTVWAIQIHDGVHDSFLEACPELTYVADGAQQSELPPYQPPAAHVCANWKNRAWLISSENPKELWYSKENLPSAALGKIAPEFHPFLIYRLDVIKGEPVALQPMDDNMIVFTRDGIYSLFGDGLDAMATAGTSDLGLSVLHEGTGCIEPKSVALTPAGILFQSYKGMYLLDKGGGLDFISTGAPIEDLIRTAGNVRSGTHLEDRHLVAFVANGAVTNAPRVIKYDYYHRLWSTAELEPPSSVAWNASTASGCAWRGNQRDLSHVVLCQGALLIERGKDDSTPYVDTHHSGSSTAVKVAIETGWIHLAQLAGVVRIWEIGIQLGDHLTTNGIRVEIDSDRTGEYSTASPQEYRFGVGDTTTLNGYLPIKPAVQRLTAFRLHLYEPVGITAAALTISGFCATLGVQRGLRRVNTEGRGRVP